MKKWTYHHVYILLIGLCIFSIILHGILLACDISLILGTYASSEFMFVSICSTIAILLIWYIHHTNNQSKHFALGCLATTALIILISFVLISILFQITFNSSTKYIIFDSKNHTIVVGHKYAIDSWGIIYEKTTPITMRKIDTYYLDDAFSSDYIHCTFYGTYFEINFGSISQTYEYLK